MDRFIIAPNVSKMLPKMQVVIVTAYNLDNQGSNPAVNDFVQKTASTALSELSAYPNAQSHPRIALYRDTLKTACNLSAKKFPQSNESLCKRLLKDKKPPRPINPVVDFYNSVSIKYAVSAGAFDLAELQKRSVEPLELRLSTPADTFKPLDAKPEEPPGPVAAGEVVYVQAGTVLTRHLAWRQAAEGMVTEGTRDVIFMSEVFSGDEDTATPTRLAASIVEDLVNGLKLFFGVEARATVLGEGMGVRTVEVENAFF
ncbi:MAG: hypothetical protein LQ339_007118 [Xanthoria mediterranea]|nr:MAG: hypothetical protein LQ339_007118 [Xanthoria mediterranea]